MGVAASFSLSPIESSAFHNEPYPTLNLTRRFELFGVTEEEHLC
jgi:hypothetical protein